MKKLSFIFVGLLLASVAGAKEKTGPHGGVLLKTTEFYIEVVEKKSALEIYLLDLEQKHPVVEDSDVKASINQSLKILSLSCATAKTNFSCLLPDTPYLDDAQVRIRAKRSGREADEAAYVLKLKHAKK